MHHAALAHSIYIQDTFKNYEQFSSIPRPMSAISHLSQRVIGKCDIGYCTSGGVLTN